MELGLKEWYNLEEHRGGGVLGRGQHRSSAMVEQFRDFHGGSAVRVRLPVHGMRVRSLVGELRSTRQRSPFTTTRSALALQETAAATKSTCTPTKTQHSQTKTGLRKAPKSWEEPRAQSGEGPVREVWRSPMGGTVEGKH